MLLNMYESESTALIGTRFPSRTRMGPPLIASDTPRSDGSVIVPILTTAPFSTCGALALRPIDSTIWFVGRRTFPPFFCSPTFAE